MGMNSNTKNLSFTAFPLILLSLINNDLMHVKSGPLIFGFTRSI